MLFTILLFMELRGILFTILQWTEMRWIFCLLCFITLLHLVGTVTQVCCCECVWLNPLALKFTLFVELCHFINLEFMHCTCPSSGKLTERIFTGTWLSFKVKLRLVSLISASHTPLCKGECRLWFTSWRKVKMAYFRDLNCGLTRSLHGDLKWHGQIQLGSGGEGCRSIENWPGSRPYTVIVIM